MRTRLTAAMRCSTSHQQVGKRLLPALVGHGVFLTLSVSFHFPSRATSTGRQTATATTTTTTAATIKEDVVDAEQFTPQECFQNLTVEQIVGVPVPLLKVDTVEVTRFLSAFRLESGTRSWQSLCRRSKRRGVDVVRAVRQERESHTSADRGRPCAADHGGHRWGCTALIGEQCGNVCNNASWSGSNLLHIRTQEQSSR